MNLLEKHIFLFGKTTPRKRSIIISFNIFTVIFSIILYLYYLLKLEDNIFDIFAFVLAISYLANLYCTGVNLIIILRLTLIWSLIFLTCVTLALFDGRVYVAPFGTNYQTSEASMKIVFAGTLAFLGAATGWHAIVKKDHYAVHISIHRSYRYLLKYIGVMVSLAAVVIYIHTNQIITFQNYVTGEQQRYFFSSVLMMPLYVGVSLILLVNSKDGQFKLFWLCICLLLTGVCLITGSRADYLPQTLFVFLLFFQKFFSTAVMEKKHMKILIFLLFCIIIFISTFYVATFIALVRVGSDAATAINMIINTSRGALINNIYGHDMVFIETGNDILGGFYGAIGNVNKTTNGGLLLGESYIDWVKKLVPSFWSVDRPEGLEFKTNINGVIMAGGGIFEVAEAYWNFGFIGAFLVPFIISCLQGSLLQKITKGGSLFNYLFYMTFAFLSFRGIWYQNFAFVRLASLMLILFIVLRLFEFPTKKKLFFKVCRRAEA